MLVSQASRMSEVKRLTLFSILSTVTPAKAEPKRKVACKYPLPLWTTSCKGSHICLTQPSLTQHIEFQVKCHRQSCMHECVFQILQSIAGNYTLARNYTLTHCMEYLLCYEFHMRGAVRFGFLYRFSFHWCIRCDLRLQGSRLCFMLIHALLTYRSTPTLQTFELPLCSPVMEGCSPRWTLLSSHRTGDIWGWGSLQWSACQTWSQRWRCCLWHPWSRCCGRLEVNALRIPWLQSGRKSLRPS